MRPIFSLLATSCFVILTGCGGDANTVNGNATAGDGVRGNVSPTVEISGNCVATPEGCPSAS